MTIYTALYNPMTEESGYITLSAHLSKEGAEAAIEKHKEKTKKEHDDLYSDEPEMIVEMKWDDFQDWQIGEMEVLP